MASACVNCMKVKICCTVCDAEVSFLSSFRPSAVESTECAVVYEESSGGRLQRSATALHTHAGQQAQTVARRQSHPCSLLLRVCWLHRSTDRSTWFAKTCITQVGPDIFIQLSVIHENLTQILSSHHDCT